MVDDENDLNASVTLLDDQPPEPEQEGYDYTGGWKMVGDLQVRGEMDVQGSMEIPKNQIYLVKKIRKGNHTDYIEIDSDEDRQLRNMMRNRVYLIWWQNLRTPIEYDAALMKAGEKAKAKGKSSKNSGKKERG